MKPIGQIGWEIVTKPRHDGQATGCLLPMKEGVEGLVRLPEAVIRADEEPCANAARDPFGDQEVTKLGRKSRSDGDYRVHFFGFTSERDLQREPSAC